VKDTPAEIDEKFRNILLALVVGSRVDPEEEGS
jgi:hypothetical protein